MKKYIFLSLSLIFLITGCSKNKETNNEITNIKLTGNPTTGYQWSCEAKDDIITLQESYEDSNSSTTGSGGTYTFSLIGTKEGTTTLTCTYKRSWEDTEYDKTKTYEINVDKKLKVTYKENNES